MNTRTLSALLALSMLASAVMPIGALAAPNAANAANPSPSPLPVTAAVPTPQPAAVFPQVPVVAPGYTGPQVQPSPGEITGVAQQPFVGIALNDAIAMALMKNPDLSIAASNTRIAAYDIQAAKGAFDVRFMVEPSVKNVTTPASNAFFAGGTDFQPIVQNYQTLQGSLQGQLPVGTQYQVGISQTKTNDNTYINAFNPYYGASLNASITQPLLKNLGMNDARRALLLSSVNQDISMSQTLTSTSQTISNVSDAYWDLVASWRAVAIDEDALHQAVLQQQSNVRLAKAGRAAPIDAVESSTQVATYQDQVFEDLQQVSIVQNNLKSEIVDDPSDPIWRANLVPTTSVLQLPRIPGFEELLSSALAHRPEVRQIADLQKQASINLKYAHNQLLPQADVQASYQSNGFAGNALPPLGGLFGTATPPPYLVGNEGQAFTNAWANKFPTYNLGVQVSLPLGNNTARADLAAAKEDQHQADVEGANLQQRVLFDVRNALQSYQSAVSRLTASSQARSAAAQVYASERRKFSNGASTTFLVLQRQVELVQAEGRELQAQTALNKAVVELQRVDGSILSANNVQFATLGGGPAK